MAEEELHDLIIVSDLHLGRGINRDTGRYYALEAFFYDDDFVRFCRYLVEEARSRGKSFKLVLNGDVFDLLRIEPEPAGPEARPRERRYGKTLGPTDAAKVVEQILHGHPAFVDAIALVLQFGHEVVFLPGNHDWELVWPAVHDVIRKALVSRVRERAGESAAEECQRLLHFEPWFYYEPGRIWVEHGCQYDPENAFRYPLRTQLSDDAAEETERDMPLGNFFQRYLYNHFGHITFIVPSTRANLRYFRWLLFNQPRLLARVIASHGPFSFQVLRRLARAAGTRDRIRKAHEAELDRLCEASGLGDKLRQIEAMKDIHADVTTAARTIGWQIIKIVGMVLLVALFTVGIWFLGFQAINAVDSGFGVKALLFLTLNFLMLSGLFVGLVFALLRGTTDVPPRPLLRAAQKIVGLLDVPIIAFGHTHDEVISPLERGGGDRAWYYNTGTWIAVFTHDVLLPRERVQFTYLRVRGNEARLLHWSPGRGEPAPVILIEEQDPHFYTRPKGATQPN